MDKNEILEKSRRENQNEDEIDRKSVVWERVWYLV